MFATLETFFGLGLIVGPTVGGALYQVGGFYLPFMALGCGILFAAGVTYFLLPQSLNERDTTDQGSKDKVIHLLRVDKYSHFPLVAYGIVSGSHYLCVRAEHLRGIVLHRVPAHLSGAASPAV